MTAIRSLAPTKEEQERLEYLWRFWARPKQLPPPGDWFIWLLMSGRGFGKTRTGAEWIIHRAKHGPFYPIALVGQTKADVRDTMVELGESSILKVSPPWFTPEYESSKRRLTWPNGMVATIFSGDEPDQLRGPQHGSAWVDELAKFKYPQETWDNLELGLRLGDTPQAVVTTTPRPIPIVKALVADPAVHVTTGSSYENTTNLSARFIERVIQKYEGTRLGRQELHGDLLSDVPGALWSRDLLEQCRVRNAPQLIRIVVAVDPPATHGENADEAGIIVAGIDEGNHSYILEDLSRQASPGDWGRIAVDAFDRWRADRIVAERNNGGDMVEHVVRTEARDAHAAGRRSTAEISYRSVWASRGKYTRAEPVVAEYERRRVHHVGMFAELEDQMCSWVPGESSPDRMDALVWALTDLVLQRQAMDEDTAESLFNWRG